METAIHLGQQIELYGFNDIDKGAMAILRKMIGNAVRSMAEKYPNFQKFMLKLESADPVSVSAELVNTDETKNASAQGNNLFFVIDNVLKHF